MKLIGTCVAAPTLLVVPEMMRTVHLILARAAVREV
jgi:hypothetical protein